MVSQYSRFFRYYHESKKHIRYLIIFLWISFTVHLYVLWFVQLVYPSFFEEEQIIRKELFNVFIETKRETNPHNEQAAISDKNNRSASMNFDKKQLEQYNHANSKIAKYVGREGEGSGIPQKKVNGRNDSYELSEESNQGVKLVKEKRHKKIERDGGGDIAPTFYEVNKPPIINLYNNGSASFATHSKDYAAYFLSMKNKIEKYHREFFPVYQYYQGLLKEGEVVVEYNVNQDGDVFDSKVVKSYGSDIVDKASLNSIKYSKNFGPLPQDFSEEDEITVQFHFIYITG